MPCIRDARVPPADAGAPPTLAWARVTIGIVRSDLDLSPEWLPLAALYLEAECICILKLCRFEASSILPPNRRVLTPYRRVLTARDYPCRWAVRIFCIAVNGAVAADVQPQLTEPISQSARRLQPSSVVPLELPESAVAAAAVRGRRWQPTDGCADNQRASGRRADRGGLPRHSQMAMAQTNTCQTLPPSLEPHSLNSKAPTRHCRAAVLR